ncbi:MAG: hypothetical protein DRQ88_10980 [Epsilonproteobacteria bacterium]|nr:MAG: hypothetical protein DRQ89_11135 [Campylobacterota bacterium]RLA64425.1 MAG: hypothetical protein DRQ88_10980 [Campylobacterota bacterium]
MGNRVSEFKKLIKESSKDWEKNKERFSKRITPTETEDGTETATQFSHGRENWDATAAPSGGPKQDAEASETVTGNKEKRKTQINLGHLVLDYFKEVSSVPKETAKRVGPGRPRKPKSEQVKTIAIKIRPEYVDMLKNLSFGRGMGTRIRMIIDQWNSLKKREKEQVEVLRRAIGELDLSLKRYARNFKRAENVEKNENTKKAMEKAVNNI